MNDSLSGDLSTKLHAWKVTPPVLASFQHEVWQRIATRQAASENAFWPRMVEWFSSQLVRPRYTAALLTLSLSLSVGAGLLHAQGANAQHWKKLEARYVSSIDPLEMGR